jgi:hypothetical protein
VGSQQQTPPAATNNSPEPTVDPTKMKTEAFRNAQAAMAKQYGFANIKEMKAALKAHKSQSAGDDADDESGEETAPAAKAPAAKPNPELEKIRKEKDAALKRLAAQEAAAKEQREKFERKTIADTIESKYLAAGGIPANGVSNYPESAKRLIAAEFAFMVNDDGSVGTEEGVSVEEAVKSWLDRNAIFKQAATTKIPNAGGQSNGAGQKQSQPGYGATNEELAKFFGSGF